jgi:hypothetical protein
MSLKQVLEELPAFSVAERQMLVLRAIELDEAGFTQGDEELVRSRLAEHERNPSSAISCDDMKAKVRAGLSG